MSVENPNNSLWYIGRYSYTMREFERLEKILKSEYWGPKDIERIQKEKEPIVKGLFLMEEILGETHFSAHDFKKISQAESQKIPYIDKVIQTLDRHYELNTLQIIEKAGLSIGSVVRTLKLLRDKKIVWLKTINDRKNNEKIYSLRRWRAVMYMVNLLAWKDARNFPNVLSRLKKEDRKIKTMLPRRFDDMEIAIPSNSILQKYYGEKTKIKNLFSGLQRGIKHHFAFDFYCKSCFKEGYISLLIQADENSNVCPKCGKETPFEKVMGPKSKKRKTKNQKLARISPS